VLSSLTSKQLTHWCHVGGITQLGAFTGGGLSGEVSAIDLSSSGVGSGFGLMECQFLWVWSRWPLTMTTEHVGFLWMREEVRPGKLEM
jgi:hypothetical protein